MNRPAPRQPSRKKAALSITILVVLTGVVFWIFKSHWAEISSALAQLKFWQVAVVLAVGLTYPVLEGLVSYVIVRSRLPRFTLRQALESAFMGSFGNVICLGAGSMPMQSYYLYRSGLPLGPGVGLMTLQYVFHKTTVLLYATGMLLLQRRWLVANTSGVMNYLPMAYFVVAAIIVGLVLLCVSPLIQRLARWALGCLPKTEQWPAGKHGWSSWTPSAPRAVTCWPTRAAASRSSPCTRSSCFCCSPCLTSASGSWGCPAA